MKTLSTTSWDLNYSTTSYEATTTSFLITYSIGDATSDEVVELRQSDCTTSYDSSLVSVGTTTKTDDTYSFTVNLDTSQIVDTDPLVDFTSGSAIGSISFCTVVERYLAGVTDTSITTGKLTVEADFDMESIDFISDFETLVPLPDNISADFETDTGLENACQCSATSFSCTDQVVGQGEIAYFCLTPSSSSVNIVGTTFTLKVPDESYTYYPTFEDNAVLTSSSICEGCAPNIYRYDILLVSGLFDSDFDYIIVEGESNLEFGRSVFEAEGNFETVLQLKQERGILDLLMSFVNCL